MKSTLLDIYKNKKTAALAAALAALVFAGCADAENELDVPQINTSGGGSQLREGPSAEVRLKSLNVYYSNDPVKKNLVNSFNSALGDFTVTDADTNQDKHVTVEAEAAAAEASVLISWAYDKSDGAMKAAVTGEPAILEKIAVPEQTAVSRTDTLVSITVTNGSKKYTTTVKLKAPGADASLETLSVKLSDSEDELLPLLGFGDGATKNESFYSSVYQYAASLATADAGIVITAKAASADSVITLTQDGTPVTATKTLPASQPETAPKFYLYSWTITGGKAGAAASKITLTSVNKASGSEVSSKYTVTLVPPADKGLEDAHLSYLQFRYGGNLTNAINFNTDEISYTATTPNTETTVKLTDCAPRGKGTAVVAYKTVSADGTETDPVNIDITSLPSTAINLPAAGSGDRLVVTATVTVAGRADLTMMYTAEFTKPYFSNAYSGSITVNGNSDKAYTLTGLSATTAGGGSVDVKVSEDNKSWNVGIDKSKGAPVSFTAKFSKVEGSDGDAAAKTYSVMYSPPSAVQPNTKTALTFDLTSTPENPVYLLVQTAADLKNMSPGENYFLTSDIDLTTLIGDWAGPKGYDGHFNGNGRKITLGLADKADTGLFGGLAGGAIIENLQVEVKTLKSNILIAATSYFGGVVGNILTSGTYTIRGVSVSGTLNYASMLSSAALSAGGIIGRASKENTADGVFLTIENCESDLQITANGNSTSVVAIGGIIGKFGDDIGEVKILNCRTGGSITASNMEKTIRAGGIIGSSDYTNWPNVPEINGSLINGSLIIKNCYSTTQISVSTESATDLSTAGGIVGFLNNKNADIQNNIALNPSIVAANNDNNSQYRKAGRVIGFASTNAKTYSNNYALDATLVGLTDAAKAVVASGAADNINGLNKTAAELSSASFWKDEGFADTVWDFTGLDIANKVYPKLKRN